MTKNHARSHELNSPSSALNSGLWCNFRARDWDPVSNEFKLYLLPSIGAAQITMLHKRLYAGELSSDLRSDVSFYPHMTIATSTLETEIVRAEEDASGIQLPIAGEVEAVTVVEFDHAALAEVARVTLRSA